MPPPTNTTAATATVLTMNTTVSQDTTGATAPYHEVWYTYTATTSDVLVGWWAAANSPYAVGTTFLQGSPSSLTAAFGFSPNVTKPAQVQMTAGVQYFFQIRNLGSTEPLTDTLHISFFRAPNSSVPAGSLAINDDAPGWPIVFLSPTTGAVLQTRLFPSGETGTILPSGVSIWHDSEADPQVIRLYDATLTRIATPAWTFDGVAPPTTSNRSNKFYLGDPGGTFPAPTRLARVTTLSTTGVLGGTVWTLPEVGLRAIGVSHDDAVLYHTGQSTGGSSIRRWDLVGNVALSDLVPTLTNYTPVKDILVLNDRT